LRQSILNPASLDYQFYFQATLIWGLECSIPSKVKHLLLPLTTYEFHICNTIYPPCFSNYHYHQIENNFYRYHYFEQKYIAYHFTWLSHSHSLILWSNLFENLIDSLYHKSETPNTIFVAHDLCTFANCFLQWVEISRKKFFITFWVLNLPIFSLPMCQILRTTFSIHLILI
jgi:hypothetical protein